jgi:hypothetical protein
VQLPPPLLPLPQPQLPRFSCDGGDWQWWPPWLESRLRARRVQTELKKLQQ